MTFGNIFSEIILDYMLHIHCSFSFRGPQVRLASLC